MGVRSVGVSIGALSKFFPEREVEAILEATGRAGKRRRKLPALDLMYYLIALGLHASEGCRSVLRRILLRKGAKQDEDVDQLCSDKSSCPDHFSPTPAGPLTSSKARRPHRPAGWRIARPRRGSRTGG